MLALLPPSSSVTRFTWSAQPAITCVPTSVEPVKTILRTSGWVTNRSPTTEPLPGSTWNTSVGHARLRAPARRAGWRSAASSSAGLSTTVLPAASAGAKPHAAIGIGKFHGTMTPTTPSGSWKVTSRPPGDRNLLAEAAPGGGVVSAARRGRCRPPSARCRSCGRSWPPRARPVARGRRRRRRRSGAAAAPDRPGPRPAQAANGPAGAGDGVVDASADVGQLDGAHAPPRWPG